MFGFCCWLPMVWRNDAKTYVTLFINIWMIDLGQETELWWLEWVLWWKINGNFECTFVIRFFILKLNEKLKNHLATVKMNFTRSKMIFSHELPITNSYSSTLESPVSNYFPPLIHYRNKNDQLKALLQPIPQKIISKHSPASTKSPNVRYFCHQCDGVWTMHLWQTWCLSIPEKIYSVFIYEF